MIVFPTGTVVHTAKVEGEFVRLTVDIPLKTFLTDLTGMVHALNGGQRPMPEYSNAIPITSKGKQACRKCGWVGKRLKLHETLKH